MPAEERWVVDRLEGSVAVLVPDHRAEAVEVPRKALPPGVTAGDVLRVTRDGGSVILWSEAVVDEEAAARRRAEGEEILEGLRGRDPGGDMAL